MQKLKGRKLGSSPDITQLANRGKIQPGRLTLVPLLSTPLLTGWTVLQRQGVEFVVCSWEEQRRDTGDQCRQVI